MRMVVAPHVCDIRVLHTCTFCYACRFLKQMHFQVSLNKVLHLLQLFGRLSEKRIAVEKEFSRIPAAPNTSKDIFALCRGFERAFAQTLEVSNIC